MSYKCCVPNYRQNIVDAEMFGTFLDKETELANCLLAVIEMAPRHLDNNCLSAKLLPIDPSQSHHTSKQLKNFRFWEKMCISPKIMRGEKVVEKKEGLGHNICRYISSCPMFSVAVEQETEHYYRMHLSMIETHEKWNSISQTFMTQSHHLISKWPEMKRMELQHQLYGNLEQLGKILNYIDVHCK